jgi:hypothetical protein
MKHAAKQREADTSALGSPLFRAVDLTEHLNNRAVTTESRKGDGKLNVWRNTIPSQHFPAAGSRVEVDGIPYRMAPESAYDNVRCAGQYVTVPEGRYDWIRVLATGERRAETEIAVHFADGHVDFEALRVSDFWHAPPRFGESVAYRTPVMHYPHHVQERVRAGVFSTRVPVSRQAPVRALRLPRHVGVHVFALTLQCTPDELTRRSTS